MLCKYIINKIVYKIYIYKYLSLPPLPPNIYLTLPSSPSPPYHTLSPYECHRISPARTSAERRQTFSQTLRSLGCQLAERYWSPGNRSGRTDLQRWWCDVSH